MSPDEIKHFLVTLDPATGDVAVEPFDNDYDAALVAYAEAERESSARGDDLDIVLLSADSLDTIKQTHSSYFNGKDPQLEKLRLLLAS
jgi:hypothetical protein